MWNAIFTAANFMAMAAWVILIFLPRRPLGLAAVLYLGVGLLCLIYTIGFVAILSGGGGNVNFNTIEGVRAIFASDGGVTIGWTHYLAFDLFVGLWIAKDADGKQISRWVQAPILFATFMAGPVGLLIWLAIREPAARRMGGRKG